MIAARGQHSSRPTPLASTTPTLSLRNLTPASVVDPLEFLIAKDKLP